MRGLLGGALAAILGLAAGPASADDLMKSTQAHFKPIPSMVPAVKDNAVTHEKIELGKLLFFDPRLSASEIISCNTCHNLGTGGVDLGRARLAEGPAPGADRLQRRVQRRAVLGRPRGRPQGAGERAGAGERRDERHARSRRERPVVDARICRAVQKGLPERGFAGDVRQFRQGGRSLRGDADHAGRQVRPVSRGQRQRAQRPGEGGPQAVHE